MLAYMQAGGAQPLPPTFVAMGEAGRIDSGTLASFYALLGDADGAMRWLTASLQDNSWADQYVAVNPVYDLLRGEPDFESFLVEIGA
jgi:hypothetical protein